MTNDEQSGNATRWVALLGAVAVAVGLWLWLGRDDGDDETDDAQAEASRGEASDAEAEGIEAKPLRRSDIDPFTAPKATVRGTVRDESGQPIAGAQVCAKMVDRDLADTARLPPHCVTTDDDGSYRLPGLLGAEHNLFASAEGFLPQRYESRSGIQKTLGPRVDLQAGQTRDSVDFVLESGGVKVEGVVKDIAGGVIEGAYISTGGGWWSNQSGAFTRSDAEGRFAMWVGPPEVSISAFAEGYADGNRSAAVPGTFVEVFLTPESVIAGKVVSAETGKPLGGVRVSAGGGFRFFGGGRGSTYSEDDGTFRLEGLNPGDYKIDVSGEELTGSSDEKVHVGLGQSAEEVVVEAHRAYSVRGMVFVDGKTPCSYGRVRLKDTRDKSGWGTGNRPQEDGSVLIKGLVPGTYEVSVSCENYLPEEQYDDIVIADASMADLSWSVHAGQTIAGTVVDHAGEPVQGARVAARMKTGKDPRSQRSNSWGEESLDDGSFELAGLLPGGYELTVWHPERPRPDEPTEVELPQSENLRDVKLELPAGGHVTGTVRDEKGEPVAGVGVNLRGPRWGGNATTNDAGRFLLEYVTVGDYRIQARRGWSEQMRAPGATDDDTAGERVSVAADETTEIDLVVESQSGRITGQVLGEGGEPIADAFVDATRESDSAAAAAGGSRARARWGSWSKQPVLTDADGRFELTNLVEGATYSVHANRKGGGDAIAEGVQEGTDVQLSVESTGALSGVVALEGGGFPERFEVTASDEEQGIYESDDFFRTDGQWRLSSLAPGSYEITVTSVDGNAKTEATLEGDAEVSGLKVVLKPRITVTGTLVDAETGEPVPGMKVSVNAEGGISFSMGGNAKPDQEDISDAQGNFKVEDAATGKVSVVVTSVGFSDNDYGWTWIPRRLKAKPEVQDIGKVELIKRKVDRGQEPGDLGFKLKEMEPGTEPEDAKNTVAFVRPEGPAATAGLKVGDEIVGVDGQVVTALDRYRFERLTRVPEGTLLKLRLADDRTLKLTAGPPV